MNETNNNKGSRVNPPRKNNPNSYGEDPEEYYEVEDESNVQYSGDEADWWREKMKRREATKKVVGVSIGAVLLGYVALRGCDDDDELDADETETNVDAISLQKNEGWDAGHTDKSLIFKDIRDFNSLGNKDFQKYLEMNGLLNAWKPKDEKYLPYFVPTLIQVTSNDRFKNNLKSCCNENMKVAYSKGLGLKELLKSSKNNEKTIIISDQDGSNSVAFAAALSDVCTPVITFDNWPHPLGIVPAHQTLAALVFYAEEVEKNKEKLESNSPLLMVLDRNRYKQYINPDTDFDNRYMAKLPTAENLKKLNIDNIMYVVDKETQELDDLNDDFAAFKEAGINVNLLDLDNFKSENANLTDLNKPLVSKSKADTSKNLATQNPNDPNYYHSTSAPVYYYGGSHSYMPFFFMHYAMYSPMRTYRNIGTPPSTIRPSSYSPTRRPTIFSSRSLSSANGFGRTRPTGFGSVSTRMSRSTGRMTGIRTGKTGSFGRVSSFGRSS